MPPELNHITSLISVSANPAAVKKFRTPENRMLRAEMNQPFREFEKLLLFVGQTPAEPADFIVLTIGIVVAVLRPAKLVAAANHRHALREEQRREHVAALLATQRVDFFVIGRPFGAAIPRMIIIVAVVVILAVRLVMLLL